MTRKDISSCTSNLSYRQAPEVSIGIPVYQGEHHLEAAVQSALAQTYSDIEVIICDNGSTDRTRDIAMSLARFDRRVRYHRNENNLGAVRNFELTLGHSSGSYFTWLAHDDLLEPDYVAETVAFLKTNDDVVLCGSWFKHLDFHEQGEIIVRPLTDIGPDSDWCAARKQFFSWPQAEAQMSIYGTFRTGALKRVKWPRRTARGQPFILDFEYTVLLPLAASGRIVALARPLRSYRHRTDSAFFVALSTASFLDKLLFGLEMKLRILRHALAAEAPVPEKLGLVAIAIRNLGVANFKRPTDLGVLVKNMRQRTGTLQKACDERLALIEELQKACDERLALIEELHKTCEDRLTELSTLKALCEKQAVENQRLAADCLKLEILIQRGAG